MIKAIAARGGKERLMPSKKPTPGGAQSDHDLIAEARRNSLERSKGYREKALALFPPICGRCGREFEGRRLRELTVHHKDHNHDNNPPDGSNWELLCVYCHDNEHERHKVADAYDGSGSGADAPVSTYRPFAGLEGLLKKER
jgi:hypothetical protein